MFIVGIRIQYKELMNYCEMCLHLPAAHFVSS